MKLPKTFVPEDVREKLFDEMLEKNGKRPSKLESIEDLILKQIPQELWTEYYGKPFEPKYATEFEEKDTELDHIHFNELDIDFIKTIHTTNFDIGLYKLDLLVIEANNKEELECYYKTVWKYEQEVNKDNPHETVKHLTKDNYLILFFINETQLDIESPLLKKLYEYYKEKFDMKKIIVREVVSLV
jgi:hypothetical protein